ncbi:MAG: glucose-6-phosphate isomerase [Bacteroidota bacterium]
MTFQSFELNQSDAGKRLQELFEKEKNAKIIDYFKNEPCRLQNFSIENDDFYLDFSKHRLSQKILNSLIDLAKEANLDAAIKSYFEGKKINVTENRAVLHTALRLNDNEFLKGENLNIPKSIKDCLEKIADFSEKVHSGNWKGFTGKPITDIVNIGIGGSDFGPKMVVDALQYYKKNIRTHFISNVDGDYIEDLLQQLKPETTLFIVVSKSFSTQETLTNAIKVKNWMLNSTQQNNINKHFVGVTAHPKKAIDFGIDSTAVFPMWDWVGGRFSLWSAVGLSVACSIGFTNFRSLLDGAAAMDKHFYATPFEKNMPVILGLLSIWYTNYFKSETELVVPYSQYLKKFPMYLQQAAMESNGKQMGRNQKKIEHSTSGIVWGTPGTNAQHAYFQLLHQGTKLVPADFIGFKKPLHQNNRQHHLLMANFFAQTEALLKGNKPSDIKDELAQKGFSTTEIEALLPHKICPGNKPTTSLLINKLTPYSLGKLISLYEHKIFVQGVLWNIYSFDQWGVELGKNLADRIVNDFRTKSYNKHDDSTSELLKRFTE